MGPLLAAHQPAADTTLDIPTACWRLPRATHSYPAGTPPCGSCCPSTHARAAAGAGGLPGASSKASRTTKNLSSGTPSRRRHSSVPLSPLRTAWMYQCRRMSAKRLWTMPMLNSASSVASHPVDEARVSALHGSSWASAGRSSSSACKTAQGWPNAIASIKGRPISSFRDHPAAASSRTASAN